MKTVIMFLLVAAAVVVRSQTPATKQCKGVDLKVSEEKMMSMMECLKEGGFESFKDITAEKWPCIFTCIMKKREVIDDGGILRKENVQKLVNEDLPDDLKQDLNTRIGVCFDENGSKVGTDNPMCVSADLVDCIRTAYATVCKD